MEAIGKSYDTTVLRNKITDGIYRVLEATENIELELCDAACLYMEQGETYTAYGAIGASKKAVAEIKFNAATKCGSCINGGTSDAAKIKRLSY